MIKKFEIVYGKKINAQSIVKHFENKQAGIGGVQLKLSHVKLLNNPLKPLPSHGGLFCPMIIKYCNETIIDLDERINTKQW